MRTFRTLAILALLTAFASSAFAGSYVAGGTFVVKSELGTILDNGGVICRGDQGDGVGGGCLLFPASSARGGFVGVRDQTAGAAVAFQVCIDNNGDGICGGPQLDDRCFDQIFFSHNDQGRFFNPLGPLPTSFLNGCEHNGGFPGYVVLLCQGVHDAQGGAHTHSLSAGSITLRTEGSGYGTFCGGAGEGAGQNPAIAKAYIVQ